MPDVIVEVEQGLLRGRISVNYKKGEFYSFYGIPYAQPPLGELRFRAPKLPKSWQGIKDATYERQGCLSRSIFTGKMVGGEDCLFLNVYTQKLPSNSNQTLKPVMVYIHGGGFQSGSITTDLYGPDYLLTQDIVLVTVNYRFGPFGFMCLEDSTLGVTGNNGLRDIIIALKWVQKNIKSFLGDPNNITLFGQSSGAISAHYLMLSPLTKGLFHKIILQSGCALHHWSEGRKDSAKILANALGFSTNSENQVLEFLMNQSAEKIFEGSEKIRIGPSPHQKRHFSPVIESESHLVSAVISEEPIKIILSGNYHKVPMIIGYASEEGMFFEYALRKQIKTDVNNIIKDFERLVPYDLRFPPGTLMSKYIAKEIKTFYFNDEEPTLKHRKQFYAVRGDSTFNYILYALAKLHLRNLGFPIYYYRFSFDGKHNIYKQFQRVNFPGACHADDVCYLFKMRQVKEIMENSREDVTIQRMTKLWTNFACRSDPNAEEFDKNIPVEWKAMSEEKMHYLDIGNELSLGVDPEKQRFEFWDKIYKLHPLLGKL